jgi:hypothetical protein
LENHPLVLSPNDYFLTKCLTIAIKKTHQLQARRSTNANIAI